MPQWSPPVIGGVTLLIFQNDVPRKMPQWSPPVIGGVTGPPALPPGLKLSRPQWSPPVIGGVTLKAEAMQQSPREATTEPAGNRRDDLTTLEGIGAVIRPQWSPPVIGGVTIGVPASANLL